ncbi:HlyD family efflux transporter periplasmic adaptor subunit [Acidiphilium sp. AL]|uniref:HlyD family efflux transporter periplasmic adaptor subunit n=1 Tax=Acidiphilium iwatense TaxID=768198 RepID=A0ABS9DV23_9PROT|nr:MULTISPECIES: HlyD family efflux transporter periplasmic adaptor subunit [Acidiphilium]MCF3946575.1 HlyD family efflux transporter periplasmic adaptor subunit [Acidiphilium iwatense]MCU4160244.1 HlyD family efflux transporter periplasmic adaptor subunit [Acidiphilium sp. AL]
MSDGLFREATLDAQREEWLGPIRLASPPGHWVLSGLAGLIGAAVILFLVFGHYTRRQTVSGALVPSSGLLNISATIAGTVKRVDVHDGETVRAGQRLLELSGDVDSRSMGLIDVLIGQSLRDQQALLEQDLATQKQEVATETAGLNAKLVMLNTERGAIAGQIAIQRQDIASTEAVLNKFKSIGGGRFISDLQMQQQKSTVFAARAQLKALERETAAIDQQIAKTTQDIHQLPLNAATQSNATRSKLASIRQQLARTAASASIVQRAPNAGIVSSIVVDPGQAVATGQSLISITPAGSILRAQLLVPSRAIGFIHRGSRLNLRYAAFPYQEFGQYRGTVVSISKSALTPSEVAALTQTQAKEPLYRVMVALDRTHVDVYGQREALRAGLALDATIVLDRRRLIQWVFEPLYGLGRDVFVGTPHHPAVRRTGSKVAS